VSDSEYSDMSEKEDDGCMEEGEKDNLFELLLVFVGADGTAAVDLKR
jgi:hypothetical protein